jgi:Flp pilus assembly protein TadG
MSGNVSRPNGPISALRRLARAAADERGAILLLVAGGMVFLLAMTGLALDSGRAYVYRARLSRAVDAAALTGARTIRLGRTVAEQQATAVAKANGIADGVNRVDLEVDFGSTANGEKTVSLTARRPVRTFFMQLVGKRELQVASTATAVAPPLDIVLVIDQSGSLEINGAWDELQAASKDFVGFFEDDFDQMGLVSFSTRAADRFQLGHGFRTEIRQDINNMRSAGWTNTADGLNRAFTQITGPAIRDRAAKVVVFFTDGRPTAFRGLIGGEDRILAAKATKRNHIAAYFDDPDSVPLDSYPSRDGCVEVVKCEEWTEGGKPPHGPVARQIARDMGLAAASRIRETGVFVYAIGLGNPEATSELARPDQLYLRQLANEDGLVDPGQPKGRFYFAPTAADLQAVFRAVAADLAVRLSR